MVWSKFSIKIVGMQFGNFVYDNRNWKKIYDNLTKKIHIWNRMRFSLWQEKITVNLILWLNLWYTAQIYTIPKYIQKKLRNEYKIFIRQTPHLESSVRYILDIDTQLNSLDIKWIQRLLNTTNALWKNLLLYQLNLIFNSNQGLALFRETQILRSPRHSNLQKQNNKDYRIQLLNAQQNFTTTKFPTCTDIEEILDQPIFWNPVTKMDTDSSTPIFTVSHPRINKFTIIKDICKFLQLGLISSMRFEEKLDHTNLKPERIYLYIVDLIFNDWKHIL